MINGLTKIDRENLVTCLKKFPPRRLKTEGETTDQEPGHGFSSVVFRI